MVQLYIDGIWNLSFRRNFGPREVMEWDELQQCVMEVRLNDEPDTEKWMLEKTGKFSVRSLYKHLMNPGMELMAVKPMWEANVPLKVKIFIWLLNKDRSGKDQKSVRCAMS